jgi:hypothetical protein
MTRIVGLQCGSEIQGQELEQWEHPLVRRLLGGPSAHPNIIMLEGFLGRGPDVNSKRLYRDADLREWYDIPIDMILCEYRSNGDQDLLSRDIVWIDRSDADSEQRSQFP